MTASKTEVPDAELGEPQEPQDIETTGVGTAERRQSCAERRLSWAEDPFADRAGKTLLWRNVNMTLVGKNKEDNRKLLSEVWGEIPQKEVTAIMGPSGSGKTSLLEVLAGRAQSRGRIKIDADVRLDNCEVDPKKMTVRKQIAFVAQEDALQVTATPREAIRFSAKLRLPRSATNEELDRLSSRILQELGLTHCADTLIGGALIRGISGGEKKRTSVGVELVVKPALVFLDEPTSGLDSFAAVQLVQVLKKVANAGSSVLFTIHQPSSDVFGSFDHLILLNMGRVMYEGAVSVVPEYFAHCGYPMPRNYNPADWMMHIAKTKTEAQLAEAGFFPEDKRILGNPFIASARGKEALGMTKSTSHDENNDGRRVTMLTETSLLFRREIRNLRRNKKLVGARFFNAGFMAFLVGAVFFGVGGRGYTDPTAFQGHFGALVVLLSLAMFGTATPSLLAFPEERPVFLREYSTNHYSVFSYFLSRLAGEALVTFFQMIVLLTITYLMVDFQSSFLKLLSIIFTLAMTSTAVAVMIGCTVEDVRMGQQFIPVLFIPQLLFAGFFISPSLMPNILRWAQYLCSLSYAVRLSLLAEFGNCEVMNCRMLFRNMDIKAEYTPYYWLLLCSLFVGFRLAALLLLKKKATKFY